MHSNYAVHYDEGAEVGYKWYETEHKTPLFAFGFGLSYTTFAYSGLTVDSAAKTARFTIRNTGTRAGTEIAEVYARLPKGSDEPYQATRWVARVSRWPPANRRPSPSPSIRESSKPSTKLRKAGTSARRVQNPRRPVV